MNGDQVSFIPTRACKSPLEAPQFYKSVVFESHKPKGTKRSRPSKESSQSEKDAEFDMKRARQEVIKLGVSAFDRQKKEEVKIQQAIKLGAKPPKNKYKNYKLLLQEKAKEAKEKETEAKFQQLGKNAIGQSLVNSKKFEQKKKKRKRKDAILDVYGKVEVSQLKSLK